MFDYVVVVLIVLVTVMVFTGVPWSYEGAALKGIVKERRLAHRLADLMITQLEHSEEEESENVADQIRRALTPSLNSGFEEGRTRSCRRVFDYGTRREFISCMEAEEVLLDRIKNLPQERARLAELRAELRSGV